MSSAGSNSSLTTTDVMDAGTSKERAVPSGGATAVEGSAIIGEEVTVDVVTQGLASAAKSKSSTSRCSEPAKEIG